MLQEVLPVEASNAEVDGTVMVQVVVEEDDFTIDEAEGGTQAAGHRITALQMIESKYWVNHHPLH